MNRNLHTPYVLNGVMSNEFELLSRLSSDKGASRDLSATADLVIKNFLALHFHGLTQRSGALVNSLAVV